MATSIEPWAAALGRIPSGLFIVTVRRATAETGMLASWVQQCSFEPPQLTVAIRKGRYLLDWLQVDTAFTVNVLSEGQKAFLTHFGKGFEPGEPAFEGLDVRRDSDNAPSLLAAHACLDCRVVGQFDAGDHVLVHGRVVGGSVLNEGKPATHVRRTGTTY